MLNIQVAALKKGKKEKISVPRVHILVLCDGGGALCSSSSLLCRCYVDGM